MPKRKGEEPISGTFKTGITLDHDRQFIPIRNLHKLHSSILRKNGNFLKSHEVMGSPL
jgi:hypothetical protein